MPRSNNLLVPNPQKTHKRQHWSPHTEHRPSRFLWTSGIGDRDTRVVRAISEGIAAGGKGDAVDPSPCRGREFGAEGVEGETGPPYCWIGTFIDVFDECTENTGLSQ
jgi:hypothetical protein